MKQSQLKNPIEHINHVESDHLLLCFCSFMCIIHGKKLNLPNIFLLLMKNQNYRDLFKTVVCVDTDFDIFKRMIDYDPALSKSKYISKYINQVPQNKLLR